MLETTWASIHSEKANQTAGDVELVFLVVSFTWLLTRNHQTLDTHGEKYGSVVAGEETGRHFGYLLQKQGCFH